MTSGVHHVASRGSGALIKRAEERRAGRLKGLSFLVCIAQKESVDELASFSNPFTSLALFFLRFAPSRPPLLPRDAEMQKFSSYRCCRRRIGRKKRGGNAARRWSPSQERARARLRAKGKKKSRSAPNLVSASSFFSGCPPPLLSLSLSLFDGGLKVAPLESLSLLFDPCSLWSSSCDCSDRLPRRENSSRARAPR